MSRFSGKKYKGALRELKAQRREEAEERQANVKPERTRAYRRGLQRGLDGPMLPTLSDSQAADLDKLNPADIPEYSGHRRD